MAPPGRSSAGDRSPSRPTRGDSSLPGHGAKCVALEPLSMDRDTAELWSGAALIATAGVLLFAPIVVGLEYTIVLFVVAVVALAAGATLVGLSRRGRAV